MSSYKNVWVIDDDRTYVYGIKRLMNLIEFGSSLSVFHNGYDAFEQLKEVVDSDEDKPELIFLDINMPVWDGWDFLEHISTLKNVDNIKLFMISSSLLESDRDRAFNHPLVAGYYVKPITTAQLKKLAIG